jgi:hypothetical protein
MASIAVLPEADGALPPLWLKVPLLVLLELIDTRRLSMLA